MIIQDAMLQPRVLARGALAYLHPLAVLLAAVAILHSIIFTWRYLEVTPFWDFWNWLADYKVYTEGHYTFHDLIKPHNEHRIATTRLVLFADALWFHMTGRLVGVVNLALLISTGFVLSLLSRIPAAARLGVPALVLPAVMVSVCQWQNLIIPFEIQHAFLCLFIVAAAACVANAIEPSSSARRSVVWSTLGAVFFLSATFSMAGGLLALPWLLLMLIMGRSRIVPAGVFIILSGAATALFFNHYNPMRQHPLTLAVDAVTLGNLATFAAGFLGSAFHAFGRVAFIAGFVGLGLFTLSFLVILLRLVTGQTRPPARLLAVVAICGTLVLTACAAAVSRLSIGMAEALEPRYATVSLLFWCSLMVLCIQLCMELGGARLGALLARSRIVMVISIAALATFNLSPTYQGDARAFASGMASQAESMRQNVLIPNLFNTMFYGSPAEAADRIAFLRDNHLSVFAQGQSSAPPPSLLMLAASVSTAGPSCAGHIDLAYRLDAARFLLRGWLAQANGKRSADWIALFTPDDVLVAAMPATEYRGAARVAGRKIRSAQGFYSGVLDAQAGADGDVVLHAAGLFRNGQVCAFAEPIVFGPLRVQRLPDAGFTRASMQVGAPVMHGAFRQNGFPPILSVPPPWPDETMFASGSAGDSAVGRATWHLLPNASDDVVVPFTTEPGVHGQVLAVSFGDGQARSITIPADSVESVWRTVILPQSMLARHGGRDVHIVATDDGTGWGEWLGVGTPRSIKPDASAAKLY